MKRSEFEAVVNAVMNEQCDRLKERAKGILTKENVSNEERVMELLAVLTVEIPTVAAHTTGELIGRLGVLPIQDD